MAATQGSARAPRPRRVARTQTRARASASAERRPTPLPRSPEEAADSAASAVARCLQAGINRVSVELPLPLLFKTDLDDWPGGIRQQFKVAAPMTERMLVELRRVANLDGRLSPSILDEADAVGCWSSTKIVCVLFPTAETLPTVIERADALDEGAIVVLVNPQYTTSGQVVSDFGWGSSKRAAEAFLDGMTPAFMTTERRISGVDARVVRAFPDDFFVYADGELVGSSQAPPSIAAIKAMIADANKGDQGGWMARVKAQFDFNAKSL